MGKFTSNNCLIKSPHNIGKTKQFTTLLIFYLSYRLYILMTGLINTLANTIAEQLNEIINDSLALKLNLQLGVYQYYNKKGIISQSLWALAADWKEM